MLSVCVRVCEQEAATVTNHITVKGERTPIAPEVTHTLTHARALTDKTHIYD